MDGVLVVNADDLGMSRGATRGITRAHQQGVVTSASLVTTTPDYADALDTCVARCPDLGIGLHFTLGAGRPVSPPERVPLLVDRDGFLRWGFASLSRAMVLGNRDALLDQIGTELDAQVERAVSDGVALDHIDSDRHVHLIPGILTRVVAAAKRWRIPYVRMGREMGWRVARLRHWSPLCLRGGVVKWLLLSTLARRGRRSADDAVRTTEHFVSYLYTGRLDLVMAEILVNLPARGVTEMMVHPGVTDESVGVTLGNRQLERYLLADDRQAELDACLRARAMGPAVRLRTFGQIARLEKGNVTRADDGRRRA